jgi:uncharacterized protein involved in exopolysaccharide biosynthesis
LREGEKEEMSSDKKDSNIYRDEIDIGKYFQVLWKRKATILIFTLICAVSAGIVSFFLPKTYQSELLLRIGNVGNVGNVGNPSSTTIENEAIVVELIKSKSFLFAVFNKYLKKTEGRDIAPKEMNVKATFERDIRGGRSIPLIRIQAEGKTPQETVDFVNAISHEIISRHKKKFDNAVSLLNRMEEDFNSQIVASEKQIEELRRIIANVEKNPKVDAPAVILLLANLNDRENLLTSLKQRLGNLKLAKSPLFTENTSVMDPPVIPEKPIKPRKVFNIAVGTLIGLMLGIFWALGVESLNSKGLR